MCSCIPVADVLGIIMLYLLFLLLFLGIVVLVGWLLLLLLLYLPPWCPDPLFCSKEWLDPQPYKCS